MDPISIIVTALAAGATNGLKPTVEQVIKDAYAGVKALIQRKYNTVVQTSVQSLEQKPDSEPKQKSVTEDLTDAGAANDKELLEKAKSLLDAVKAHDRETAAKLNINFEKIEADYFKLVDAWAEGDVNVTMKNGKFDKGIDLKGLIAGKK